MQEVNGSPMRRTHGDDSRALKPSAVNTSESRSLIDAGGQWKPNAEDDELPQGRPGAERPSAGPSGRKSTPAMGVSDFLDKGMGGAALPRKRADRKDKEKSKRSLGQSSIGEWKSEAEMVLRQQYD